MQQYWLKMAQEAHDAFMNAAMTSVRKAMEEHSQFMAAHDDISEIMAPDTGCWDIDRFAHDCIALGCPTCNGTLEDGKTKCKRPFV